MKKKQKGRLAREWKIVGVFLMIVLLAFGFAVYSNLKEYYISGVVVKVLDEHRLEIELDHTSTHLLANVLDRFGLYLKDSSEFKEGDTIKGFCSWSMEGLDPPCSDAYWIFH